MGECETPTHLHVAGRVTAVSCGYYHMAVMTGRYLINTVVVSGCLMWGNLELFLVSIPGYNKGSEMKQQIMSAACIVKLP